MTASPWLGLWLEGSLLFPWHKPKLQASMEHLGFSIALGWGVGVEHKGSEMLASRIVHHPVAQGSQLRMASGPHIQKSLCLNPAFPTHSHGWVDAGRYRLPQYNGAPQSITDFPLAPTTFSGAFDSTQDRTKPLIGLGPHSVRITGAAWVHTAA